MNSTRYLIATAAMAFALAIASTVSAQAVGGSEDESQASSGATTQNWSAWGGTIGMRWNRDLAGDLGLQIRRPTERLQELSWREHERFELRQSGSLDFRVGNGNLQSFVGGSLQVRGGYVLETSSGDIDLTNFSLRTRADNPLVLDLIGADGKSWFYVDRLMYELLDNNQTLAVQTMDLRISEALAQRLGHAEVAGWQIADMQMMTQVFRQGAGAEPDGGTVFDWHGTLAPDGGTYQADLFMQVFTPQYSRCTGCTGVSPTSQVVFTPTSTLKNNVNNGTSAATIPGDPMGTSTALWTADIPWYSKFSGNFPPYGNDQHPYLIWNMYRVNADGSIDQIGRSGVKHAFLTTNQGCASGHGLNSHVLGLQCSDTYGTGNNDSNSDLGPRSEIIPATNQWGRCGSIYDTNCDGSSNSSGNNNYSQRLIVAESQIAPSLNAGASYLFESWYLAREDINIYNSMATKSVTPSWGGSIWNIGTGTNYRLGSAFDRWMELATPAATTASQELVSGMGHAKVAVKAFDLGGGSWRYEYVVMNYDFARGFTEGSEPNLRVVHNFGFDSFSIPAAPGVSISNLDFSDGDMDAGNNWTSSNMGGVVKWTAPVNATPLPNVPAVLNALNWGTMFRFSFVANGGPEVAAGTLHIAQSGFPAGFSANLLGPANDVIFQHGFETP